jgi:hypothetical protein
MFLLDAIIEEADRWKLVGMFPFISSDLCLGSCKSGYFYLVLLLSIKEKCMFSRVFLKKISRFCFLQQIRVSATFIF